MEKENRPKVGLGVTVIKDGKVLMGRRKNTHGTAEWAWPGGHLEYMESFEECSKRETREECGIEIQNVRFEFLANVGKYVPKHYVHVGLVADWKSGEPRILEPEKAEFWKWFDAAELPEPLFEMCKMAFESYRTGKSYYDLQR